MHLYPEFHSPKFSTMGSLAIALVVVAQLMCTVDGYTWTVSVPGKQKYMPGESFSMSCSGTYTPEENVVMQFVKESMFIPRGDGTTPATPYVVANFDTVEAPYSQTGRYKSEGSHDSTQFDYTFTIEDLKPEDTGNYSCGMKAGSAKVVLKGIASVTVLGPIKKMAILYKANNEDISSLKNNPEKDDNDGKITFPTQDPPGKLACWMQVSTIFPGDNWDVTLYDPQTQETENVKSLFRKTTELQDNLVVLPNGNLLLDFNLYYLSDAPDKWTIANPIERFGIRDSGKILKFTATVEGHDAKTVSTLLDIQYGPGFYDDEAKIHYQNCFPWYPKPEAPIGTKDFTLLCYTRSNPEATVTWKANGEALRQGITVHNKNEGPYLVSTLVIEEVQASDFTKYTFTATNDLGSHTYGDGVDPWEITQGTEVSQADPEDPNLKLPWKEQKPTNRAPLASVSGTGLLVVVIFAAFY